MPQNSLLQLRTVVSNHLSDILKRYQDSFGYVGPEIKDLFTIAGPLLERGKRLRAGFLAAGWRSFGGSSLDPAEVQAGAGLELFQLAALVHDDLMDASPTRRGLPSAHHQFHALHVDRGMISRADDFGAAGALLLGDLLLVAAENELHQASQHYPSSASQAREVFEQMMAEVTFGQYLDIYAQSAPWNEDPQVDLDRAHRVIKAKSASYSVEHPLALGAAMAGASSVQREAIRKVGLPVGEAFQLRDDVISVFGEPSITGKPAGDDLREGKRTVLVTLAMTLASPQDATTLKEGIGNPDLNESDVEEIRKVLERSGALSEVEKIIDNRAHVAEAALEKLHLDEESAALLRELSQAAITRNQ